MNWSTLTADQWSTLTADQWASLPLDAPPVPTVAPSVTSQTATTATLAANLTGGTGPFTYGWGVTVQPAFSSPQISNSAIANPVVTFDRAGIYRFSVTVKDSTNTSATATVDITISQVAAAVRMNQATAAVLINASHAFSATGTDQFAQPMTGATWSVVSGAGSIDATGNYSASSSLGNAVVRATIGSMHADVSIDMQDHAN